ncbi:MAG TPA: O-antigen ligase family protein, partial [Candidatus Methylomirabilis sp.]|nr:O-antigen ligase family protein [Candidatus Methylomirabilis sp.]
ILNLFQNKDGVNKIGLSLAVGALAVSAYAIFQKLTGLGIANPLWAAATTRRAVSFFGYPNAVGLYLAPIIPVLVGFLFLPAQKNCAPWLERICYPLPKEKISPLGISRAFLGFIILLLILAVYYAKSYGALVGLTVAGFIFCLLADKRARIAAIIIVLLAGIGIYFYPPVQKPLMRKITIEDLSGQVRRYQWKETLNMLNDGRQIFGAGLDNYQKTIAPYHQPGFFYDDGTDPLFHQHTVESAAYRAKTWQPVEIYMYPHNIILNFWSELGLAGLFLFIWIFGKVIYNLSFIIYNSQVKKNTATIFLALGLLGAFTAIVIHGLVDVPYFKNDLSALFWILIALSVLISKKNLPSQERKAE